MTVFAQGGYDSSKVARQMCDTQIDISQFNSCNGWIGIVIVMPADRSLTAIGTQFKPSGRVWMDGVARNGMAVFLPAKETS